MKRCYQTRLHDGLFIGLASADQDPLEPGRVVLPGGCVDTAPPPFEAGQQARFAGGGWIIEPSTGVPAAPPGVAVAWDGQEFQTAVIPIPDLTVTQRATWNGGHWEVEEIPPPETPPTPTLSDAEKLEVSTGFTPAALKKLLAGAS